jgi:hypothetical protein
METTTVPLEAREAPVRRPGWFWPHWPFRHGRLALRRSERHVRTVWLIIVTPPPGDGRIINVTVSKSWRHADSLYQDAVAEVIEAGSRASVKLSPYRTPLSGSALMDEILSYDDLEVLPAAREFRP